MRCRALVRQKRFFGEPFMKTVVISVIGLDCPGVVYLVSDVLSTLKVNIEAVTQTILQGQFAAIFVVALPDGVAPDSVQKQLARRVAERGMHLTVNVHPFEQGSAFTPPPSEPFVVTVTGPDRLDVISSISRIFAEHDVNIENLKAILPELDDGSCLLVFEVAVPISVDRSAFRRTLLAKAEELGLQLSIQHRDIFEALHRVSPL